MNYKCIALVGLIMTTTTARAQSIGFGYSSNKSFLVDCTWTHDKSIYQLGLAVQQSDAVGKKVDSRLPNYGLSATGTGNSYASLDFGVGFKPTNSVKVVFIGSAGQREYFTNYADGRFNGGGYHIVDNTKFVAGGGISVYIDLSRKWGAELGFNSLHGALATIQYLF